MPTNEPAEPSAPRRVPPVGELLDLSQPLRTALPTVPGDPGVRVEPFASHAVDGYAMAELHLGSHSGTHMDAPRHFFPHGRTLDSYPVTRFLGRTIVVDLRDLEPDSPITPEMLRRALERAGASAGNASASRVSSCAGGFVVLWLGWDVNFGGDLMWRHPFLTEAGAHLLVDIGVTLLGTDAASIDRSAVVESYPAHQALLGNDILVVENLCGLGRLGAGSAICAFFPLPFVDADGSPVRAVAWPTEVLQ